MTNSTETAETNRESALIPAGTLLGAIDIGSNSIKLTIGRQRADGGLEELTWRTEVVRLGAGLEQSGALAPDRIAAAIAVLSRFRDEALALGASGIAAVATEATRAARNSEALLSRAATEAGVPITVITGETEAALSFRGLAVVTDISGTVLVADIGGGSTELMFGESGRLVRSGSVAVGSGRLTDRHVRHDPPRASELAACEAAATAGLLALRDQVRPTYIPGLRLILVGGTGEYLGQMVPDSTRISPADIAAVLAETTRLTAAVLAARLGIPEMRAQVLPAGFAIVSAVHKLTEPDITTVGRSGLRAGILLEAFAGRWPVHQGSGEQGG